MKLKTLLLAALLSTSFIGATYADFQDGLDAFHKGDYKAAFNEWKPLAEQGNASAQYNIGWLYRNGKGVLKDYKEAAKWYRKAAEQGYASAQAMLGKQYIFGRGVLKDLSKAKYWTKKAYENPDADADIIELAEKGWNLFELWKY